MDSPQADAALRRLAEALTALEAAVDNQMDRRQRRLDSEAELQRANHDRSRLAQSLDATEARASRLEEVNRDVARRLVGVMEGVRSVLARRPQSS